MSRAIGRPPAHKELTKEETSGKFVTHCDHLMTGTKDAGMDAAPRLPLVHRRDDLWEEPTMKI